MAGNIFFEGVCDYYYFGCFVVKKKFQFFQLVEYMVIFYGIDCLDGFWLEVLDFYNLGLVFKQGSGIVIYGSEELW